MMSNRKNYLLKAVLVAAAIATPIIYAYEFGPDPGKTGAPGDNPTGCIESGCHTGTINSTAGASIAIVAAGGTTYVPGQTQKITVTITDPSEKKYGFQLSARVDSNPSKLGAGLMAPIDGNTQVLCADGSNALASGCPAALGSLQWAEHTFAGYGATKAPSASYTFNWTPPATNVGTVTLYAAGNSVTGALVVTGTHTFTTKLQLTPTTSTVNPNAPTIGALLPHQALAAGPIQAGSFVDLYGTNLAPAFTQWNNDFPTSIAGTSVTINGKPAYLLYVSPTVIALQAPDDTAVGSVSVVVTTTAGGASAPATTTLSAYAPALFLFDGKYPAAIVLSPDGSGALGSGSGSYDFLGPAGRFAFKSRAAKKGDTLLLYATGMGPVNPPVAAGKPIPDALQHPTTTPATVSIGGVTQSVTAYETFTGEYQLGVAVPLNVGSGDQPLVISIGGLQTQSGIFIPVQ